MPQVKRETGDHFGIQVTCQTENKTVGSVVRSLEDGQPAPDDLNYMMSLAYAHETGYPGHAILITFTNPRGV